MMATHTDPSFHSIAVPIKPKTGFYQTLAMNTTTVPPFNTPSSVQADMFKPLLLATPPTQQVAIIKTVNNTEKPADKACKPFKLPTLVLVGLEAAGLGILAFVGNYMGKLAYCEANKQSIAGGKKTFDSLAAHSQALKQVIGYYQNENFYSTQVNGSWLGHANQLTALIKEYYANSTAFTGVRLQNLKPEAIRQEMYGYAMTALNYYRIAGHEVKQEEIANLIYDYKLSIPEAAHTNIDEALKVFKATDCERIPLWDDEKIKPLLYHEGIANPITHQEWKTSFIAEMAAMPEFKNREEGNNSTIAADLLNRINTYSAMMHSLDLLSSIHSASTEEQIPQQIKAFWQKNYFDLKPLQPTGNQMELTLLFKAFEIPSRSLARLKYRIASRCAEIAFSYSN
jgi:hypothetical protein